jgi:hypothetical protein
MAGRQLLFRAHALRRMFERRISVHDVRHVVESGETIAEYLDDRPMPSRLVLGWGPNGPLHVVAADDPDSDITVVIAAYRPDPVQWNSGFRWRRQ